MREDRRVTCILTKQNAEFCDRVKYKVVDLINAGLNVLRLRESENQLFEHILSAIQDKQHDVISRIKNEGK